MDRLFSLVFLGFPGGSVYKESTCNAGDLGLIPGLGNLGWETWAESLIWKDALEEGMATHSSILD